MFDYLAIHWGLMFAAAAGCVVIGIVVYAVGNESDDGKFFLVIPGLIFLLGSNVPFWAGVVGLLIALIRYLGWA